MKAKYLLSMLLGGTMLAACSVEDDLNPTKVAQEATPSAPIFNVSFEDGGNFLTRALYDSESDNLTLQADIDLLSLYHNIKDNYTDFANIQNAIYAGGTEGDGVDGSALSYSTKAYVMPGNAIMVYPADITADWMSKAPVVEVELEQTPATKYSTPYMSDILNIENWAEEDEDQVLAGYNKKYDIVMRRAATTLNLKIEAVNMPNLGNLAPVEVKKVSFVGGEGSGTFTKKAKVIINEGVDVNRGAETENFWALSPALEPETESGSTTISTTDIDEATNRIATFTLLPVASGFEFEGNLVVETTYGNVTIDGGDEETVSQWANPKYDAEDDESEEPATLTTNVFMSRFMAMLGGLKAKSPSAFEGEYVGKAYDWSVKVDFSNVDMNNMHVKDAKALETALKVYKAFSDAKIAGGGEADEVTLILDGGTDGLFEIEQEIWKNEVMPVLESEEYHVTLAACATHGKAATRTDATKGCVAIVLKNDGSEGNEVDVPALVLGESNDQENHPTQAAEIRLAGKYWQIDEHNATMELGKVSKLVVMTEAGLTLVGNDTGVTVEVTSDEEGFSIVNNGTIDVKKVIRLQTSLDNYKTVNISGVDDRLRMAGTAVVFTNHESQNYTNAGAWEEGGVINNSGTLTIVENSGAEINNYGTLKIKTTTARTLITRNGICTLTGEAKKEPVITNAFGPNNKLGTIWLEKKGAGNNNLTIEKVTGEVTKKGNTAEQGFVKYLKTVGETCAYANYVVLDEASWVTDKAYVEIKEGVTDEITVDDTDCTAVMIPTKSKIFIPKNKYLNTKYLWLQGFVTRAGKLNEENGSSNTNFEGYFGGVDTDRDKIDSFQ